MAFDSLFTGISALNAYQTWIDTISNNIANSATTGFKGQRVTFADLLYQQNAGASGPTATNGGVNPQDIGLGVKINSIDTQFAQGGLQTTGINTDLALNGDGFFILHSNNGPVYTRDGAFTLNANGQLVDAGSGNFVQGFTANNNGQITSTTLGNITIPIGLKQNATATGAGTKLGPQGDQNFDVAAGGNLDQTQWSQQFLNAVGASASPGQPVTISTTLIDSLGNPHQATITYTPDATGSAAATVATVAGGAADTAGAVTVAPATSQNDTITITGNAAGTAATITDTLGNSVTANAGQTVTVGGATFTLAAAIPANGVETLNVTSAQNGLPTTVQNANGQAVVPATRWSVNVSFNDGTQFSTIATPGSIAAGGAITPPTFGTASSGSIGFVYFDQNGQFINSSSIEGVAAGQSIGAAAGNFLHTAGNGTPSINQGNQINVTTWGPSVGNNAQAPTAGGAAATPGPIGLDFSNDSSLAEASSASILQQNGFTAGTLSNITVQQDGSVLGSFSNGQQRTLARVAVATFQNEGGLSRLGGNAFGQTAASGLAQIGTANTGRFGAVIGGALEQSNVSLANEFTNLIVAQRAFEANTRGIETGDQNLQTVIHLNATEN